MEAWNSDNYASDNTVGNSPNHKDHEVTKDNFDCLNTKVNMIIEELHSVVSNLSTSTRIYLGVVGDIRDIGASIKSIETKLKADTEVSHREHQTYDKHTTLIESLVQRITDMEVGMRQCTCREAR